MSVPVATAIRKAHPNCKIFWAVEKRCADVIDTENLVNTKWEADREAWKAGRWSPAMWRSQLGYYLGLREHNIEYGLDLQGHSKTALCLKLASPQRRLTARWTDPMAARLNPIWNPASQPAHTVVQNMAALRDLTELDGKVEFIMPPAPATEPALVTISTGAGQAFKEYPLTQWKAIAAALVRKGLNVVALGGPTDPKLDIEGVTNLVGQLTLGENMRWVAKSSLHLAADTGSGHMAAAYGVPAISIFGPTDPALYRPYSNKTVVLRNGQEAGMVSAEEVLNAAQSILAKGANALSH